MRDPCIPTNPDLPHSRAVHVRARTQNRCVVCGQENPHGLRIHYVEDRDGGISAEWQPTVNCEGVEGIVHGGIISTFLDEAMSKAVAATDYEALTGELRVRFRHHVGQARTCESADGLCRASNGWSRPRLPLQRPMVPNAPTHGPAFWRCLARLHDIENRGMDNECRRMARTSTGYLLSDSREEAAWGLLAGYFDGLASIKEHRT
jgi:acyl-coenzyme A thioesterase PaaI-like protein